MGMYHTAALQPHRRNITSTNTFKQALRLNNPVLVLVWRLCLPDGAHLGELVDRLVAVVDVLSEEVGELLEAKDLERAVGRDLADGRGQEAVDVVAVARLHEDRRV